MRDGWDNKLGVLSIGGVYFRGAEWEEGDRYTDRIVLGRLWIPSNYTSARCLGGRVVEVEVPFGLINSMEFPAEVGLTPLSERFTRGLFSLPSSPYEVCPPRSQGPNAFGGPMHPRYLPQESMSAYHVQLIHNISKSHSIAHI